MLLSGHLSNPSFFGVDSHRKLRPSLSFCMGNQLLYRVVKHISYRGENEFEPGLKQVFHTVILPSSGSSLPRLTMQRSGTISKENFEDYWIEPEPEPKRDRK
jgi:hypothetical protein